MDNAEIRLRLIEAASALPAVRVLTDPEAAAAAAVAVADVWYHEIIEVRAKPNANSKRAHRR